MLETFPFRELLLDERRVGASQLAAVERLITQGDCANGYLYAEREHFADMLLIYNKRMHSAVRFKDGRSTKLPLQQFFAEFSAAPAFRARLCRTDVGLVLLMAVVFQNEPSLRVPSNLADIRHVLAELEIRGESAGIIFSRGGERNLVFCRSGAPVAVYFANPKNAAQLPVRDQIVRYCTSEEAGPAALEIFHDLSSARDEDAGRSFGDLLSGRSGPLPFFLTVHHGQEVVERRLISTGRASVGRAPANDIVIDHLSVSRNHCVFHWDGPRLVVEDTGSANGTYVNGTLVDHAFVSLNDAVSVGDFTVVYHDEAESTEQAELETMFIDGPQVVGPTKAQLLYRGNVVVIDRPVFTIGSGADAGLRLKGFRIQPMQASVVRERGDTYRLVATPRGRKVTVNGEPVREGGVVLASGQNLAIGGHAMVFVLAEGEASV